MLRIKLFRYGKNDQAHYRIVVAEKRSKRGGDYIDLLGSYDPHALKGGIIFDYQKYTNWLQKGAQPTPTVAALAEKSKPSNQ